MPVYDILCKRGDILRRRLFEIIEKSEGNDLLSTIYDIFMLAVIFISIVPLAFKEMEKALQIVDYVCVSVFIMDYLLRWVTSDIRLNKKAGFIIYPVTPMAAIDLLAILPSFNIIGRVFRLLKIFRVFKALRIFKTLRYSKNFMRISRVIKNNAAILWSLLLCAVFYIMVSALFIFSIEPESFNDFFEAIYWATTALTTVGYGDVYPITVGGRMISMISSFFGIAIVALPSGVITAGFIKEMQDDIESKNGDTIC